MPPTPTVEEGGNPHRFRRIYFLEAPPGRRVGCKQRFKPGGSSGLDSQLLGTILRPFRVFGPGPLSEYLTHFEILKIQFFSNSPRDHAHWNRTAILDSGVPSV